MKTAEEVTAMERKAPRSLALAGMILSLAVVCLYILGLLHTGRQSAAPFEEVSKSVFAAVDTSTMQPADNQMFRRLYGLQPADYEGVALYYPVTNMGAEEILVIKLSDMSQQEAVVTALEQRVADQINVFEGYGAEQTALLQNAIVDVQGNYILLAVHPDGEAARAAFRATL